MPLVYDLHSHSVHSDGTLKPRDLLLRAKQNGVYALALTDHDGVGGISEAFDSANEIGINFVPGVEISVTWEAQTIHIVGLQIDWKNDVLREGLELMRQQRIARAEKLASKLEACGIPGVWDHLQSFAGKEAPTRTHFGRFLVEQGHAPDLTTAFNRWLGRKGKAFVRGEWASLEQAVSWINAAGGQAVIAHPGRYQFTLTKLRVMIKEFLEFGGAGMEVVSSSHNDATIQNMTALCKQFPLLASAGSDFHSPGNTRVDLGFHCWLPPHVKPIWKDWDTKYAKTT